MTRQWFGSLFVGLLTLALSSGLAFAQDLTPRVDCGLPQGSAPHTTGGGNIGCTLFDEAGNAIAYAGSYCMSFTDENGNISGHRSDFPTVGPYLPPDWAGTPTGVDVSNAASMICDVYAEHFLPESEFQYPIMSSLTVAAPFSDLSIQFEGNVTIGWTVTD